MFFRVSDSTLPSLAHNCAYLLTDAWDDWFEFRTMFTLFVFDETGGRHQIGSVKIGRMGLLPGSEVKPGQRAPEMPATFDGLSGEYFSLGQGEDYYESLNLLRETLRLKVLQGLRDCAFDEAIFEAAQAEPVMRQSLLRSTVESAVTGRLRRLSRGDVVLTPFKFGYTLPPSGPPFEPPTMSFEAVPHSQPPTNVHVLIGRNGVGKSRAMRGLVKALLGRQDCTIDSGGRIVFEVSNARDALSGSDQEFPRLVLVSFSAFDEFLILPEPADRIAVEHVGLHKTDRPGPGAALSMKTAGELARDFASSLERCRTGMRMARWLDAVATLETDDLFAQAEVRNLMDDHDDWGGNAERRFRLLSSGHAIVLLTITRLIELVDERTMVLIDEPEGHLHPPLLSAFIRCLSRLLVSRNGLAIVATHSPVVLQEVARTCAWKIRRTASLSEVERPSIETFGENIGILTREVFGLEVTRSGFHTMLASAVFEDQLDYDDVLERFDGQLGAEARAIVRSLVLQRAAS